MSLFDELGGAAAVDAAVDIFYRKMLGDDRVARYFETTDMDGQRAKQAAFLTMVMGGPNNYTGKDMREAHKHLNLTGEHVDIVIHHLGASLAELGVPADKIQKVAEIANSVRSDVTNS